MRSQMRIFMVDDDKEAVEWVIEVLKEHGGHEVTKVSTISEAEAEFTKPVWTYDLLILDVQLRASPGESVTEEQSHRAGLVLLRKFRRRWENARVLILT